MLEQGLPITTVAAILGHANTSTTLSVHAHIIEWSEDGAAALMEAVLQGSPLEPLNPESRPSTEARWPNEGQIRVRTAVDGQKSL
jgi:hypothetical protein